MNVERKGHGDAIRLRLKMNEKTTEELLRVVGERDPSAPSRYLHDLKTRKAATVVLRVRGVMANAARDGS